MLVHLYFPTIKYDAPEELSEREVEATVYTVLWVMTLVSWPALVPLLHRLR